MNNSFRAYVATVSIPEYHVHAGDGVILGVVRQRHPSDTQVLYVPVPLTPIEGAALISLGYIADYARTVGSESFCVNTHHAIGMTTAAIIESAFGRPSRSTPRKPASDPLAYLLPPMEGR